MNPVIVHTDVNPGLVLGESYELSVLEKWLTEKNDDKTKYGPNTALKAMIRLYRRAEIKEIW